MNTRSPKIITTKQEIKTTSNIGFFHQSKIGKNGKQKKIFFSSSMMLCIYLFKASFFLILHYIDLFRFRIQYIL